MAIRPELATLATEMAALESETFEIKDYATNDGALLIVSTCDSSSCSSSTCTSTTSCSG